MLRLLQFIAALILVRFVFRALARLLSASGPGSVERRGGEPLYRGQMVRDPVCGIYIPEQNAISERRSGQVYHFCSENCRESFDRSRVMAK